MNWIARQGTRNSVSPVEAHTLAGDTVFRVPQSAKLIEKGAGRPAAIYLGCYLPVLTR